MTRAEVLEAVEGAYAIELQPKTADCPPFEGVLVEVYDDGALRLEHTARHFYVFRPREIRSIRVLETQ